MMWNGEFIVGLVFSSIFVIFVIVVFPYARPGLSRPQRRILAIASSVMVGFLFALLSGALLLSLDSGAISSSGRISIQAGGGMLAFFFVLWWWKDDFAPLRPAEHAPVITVPVPVEPTPPIAPLTDVVDARPPEIAIYGLGRLPLAPGKLYGRDALLKRFRDIWKDGETHVLTVHGLAGCGKTTLVRVWIDQLLKQSKQGPAGVERIFCWTFEEPTDGSGVGSTDPFIAKAFDWFGGGTEWVKMTHEDRGERLAGLVRQNRTLLLLDRLEPFQLPPGQERPGAIFDHTLPALIRGLARENPGLAIITTRLRIADLDGSERNPAANVEQIELPNLKPDAGAALLKKLLLPNDRNTDKEIGLAASEFDSHCLALVLLASYLNEAFGGDVTRRSAIGSLEQGPQGGQARRVMASYEAWFKDGRELAVLRVLSLFYRPASQDVIDSVCAAPPIPGLTEPLQDLVESDWNTIYSRLRAANLLVEPDPSRQGDLKVHLLVRQFFGERFQMSQPAAWKAAHLRIFEYLLRKTEGLVPETIGKMADLYAAVFHGCRAGEMVRSLEVFRTRIHQGEKNYSTNVLGAFGADLTALSFFFEKPWTKLSSGLDPVDQADIVADVGFRLLALGRLREAVKVMEGARDALEKEKSKRSLQPATENAINLSEIYATLGRIPPAIETARKCVAMADECPVDKESRLKIHSRTTLAYAMWLGGDATAAEKTFKEAEALQAAADPQFPRLHSLRGYRYCELLLARGEYEEVRTRARESLRWNNSRPEQGRASFYEALDHLLFGKASLFEALERHSSDFGDAGDELDIAVSRFEDCKYLDEIPRGLLARAELAYHRRDWAAAQADLARVQTTAKPSGMLIYLADVRLLEARILIARGRTDEARSAMKELRSLIDQTGYRRLDEPPRALSGELGGILLRHDGESTVGPAPGQASHPIPARPARGSAGRPDRPRPGRRRMGEDPP
jgi:tetratricopeptide (TPR) repeat protein